MGWAEYPCPNPKIVEYLSALGRVQAEEIVALIGRRGTGKTQMATMLGAAWKSSGHTARYTTAMEMFDALKSGYNQPPGENAAVQAFMGPSLLVIDELHVRLGTPWEEIVLATIVDRRYRDLKTTVLVSNLEHDAFRESVGASIYDRIRESGAVLECNWPGFRGAEPAGGR